MLPSYTFCEHWTRREGEGGTYHPGPLQVGQTNPTPRQRPATSGNPNDPSDPISVTSIASVPRVAGVEVQVVEGQEVVGQRFCVSKTVNSGKPTIGTSKKCERSAKKCEQGCDLFKSS